MEYIGCLCILKIENYMCNVYAVKDVILYKKDNKFYDSLTNETYNILKTDEEGKLNYHEEGLYFTHIEPLIKEKTKGRTRR